MVRRGRLAGMEGVEGVEDVQGVEGYGVGTEVEHEGLFRSSPEVMRASPAPYISIPSYIVICKGA